MLKYYSDLKEKICEHDCNLVFNQKEVVKITITDHYRQKTGREMITHELIVELIRTLDGHEAEPEPKKKLDDRDVFVRSKIPYRGKTYRLIFWFKDNTPNHLWIRNCYRVD